MNAPVVCNDLFVPHHAFHYCTHLSTALYVLFDSHVLFAGSLLCNFKKLGSQ